MTWLFSTLALTAVVSASPPRSEAVLVCSDLPVRASLEVAADEEVVVVVFCDTRGPLHLRVRQEGIDVEASWRDAHGFVQVAGNELGRHADEYLLLEAIESGGLEIKLRSELGVPSGRVGFLLERLDGSAEDRAYLGLLEKLRKAELLQQAGSPEAVAVFESVGAAATGLELGLRYQRVAAQAFYSAALASAAQGSLSRATMRLRQVSDLYDGLNDPIQQGWAENDLGLLLEAIGETYLSTAALAEAKRLHQAAGHEYGLAASQNNQCLGALHAGLLSKAGRCFEALHQSLVHADEGTLEAAVFNNLGGVSYQTGDFQAAVEYHERAMAARSALRDWNGVTQSANNLGLVHRSGGRIAEALGYYQKSLDLARSVGLPRRIGLALANLGALRAAVGDLDNAEALAREGLTYGLSPRVRQGAVLILAEIALRSGKKEEALALAEQALVAADELGVAARARAALVMARGLLANEQSVKGLALIDMIASDALENPVVLGGLEVTAAAIHIEQGDPKSALARARNALEQLANVPESALRSRALVVVAQAQSRLGLHTRARAATEQALLLDARIGQSTGGGNLSAWWWKSRASAKEVLLESMIGSAMDTPKGGDSRPYLDAVAIFEANEQARLREFGWLQSPSSTARSGSRLQEVRLLQDLTLTRSLLDRQPPESARAGALRARSAELANRLDLLGPSSSALADGLSTEGASAVVSTVEQLAARLRPGDKFLQFGFSQRNLVVVSVSKEGVVAKLIGDRSSLEEEVVPLLAALASHAPGRSLWVNQQLAALGRKLLGPVLAAHDRRLIVSADGVLDSFPFAALGEPAMTGYVPVIQNREVARVPALGLLRGPRADAPSNERAIAAFVGDPVYSPYDERMTSHSMFELERPELLGSDQRLASAAQPCCRGEVEFGRLRGSEDELVSLRSLVEPKDLLVYVGMDAQPSVLRLERVRRSRILHISAHARSDDSDPILSGIHLSDSEGQSVLPGFVGVYDVMAETFNNELVILAGCATNRGPLGGGVSGLARAFIASGARAVIASDWQVQDRATSLLIGRFLRHLLAERRSPMEALALAQRGLRSDPRYRAPYFWAGFVLIGEWQKTVPQRPLAASDSVVN